MPPAPFVDVAKLDQSSVAYGVEEIRKTNLQRHEMEQLSGVFFLDPEGGPLIAAYRDIRDDEWWVRGHIPGRPLFPGVLMLEAAAQAASFLITRTFNENRFLGFGGVEDVRFRDTIVPPARLILVGKAEKLHRRQSIVAVQGFVDAKMVFEARILGMYV
jgi:3-hydroxyacyl-[acyl-carrier-protein] dehydratase